MYYIMYMNKNQVFILADDLTGANDTAIQFAKQGMSALVVTHDISFESSINNNYDILSFNSDTRAMSPMDAYLEVRSLVQHLKLLGLEGLYYKKVDSVLRGNPGPELAAVMDELDIDLAITAPSFPANKSVLENGMLKSGKVGQSAINAVKIFANNITKKVDSIPLNIIRQGSGKAAEYVLSRYSDGIQVFVADTVTDEDLRVVSLLSTVIEKPFVLAGAAALANQIAHNMEMKQAAKNQPLSIDSDAPVLVLAGTRQGETAAQIITLCKTLSTPVIRFKTDLVKKGRSEEAINFSFKEAARHMEKKPSLCVVAVESMFESEIPEGSVVWNQTNDTDSLSISSALGTLTGKLAEAFQFPVMITTGGDITLQVCKCLGVTGIEPLVEICPGIPIGRITGGNEKNERYIISKSGRFGNKETLVDIFNYIQELKKKN